MRDLRSLSVLSLFVFMSSSAAISQAQTTPDTFEVPDTPEVQTRIKRVVEPVPTTKNIHRVVAAKTPSGFEVPRYVSLKYGKINGRSGPSMNHPILWEYRRRGLPVIVVAETEQWRKVRDISGDEAWVYISGLSGERHVIALSETTLVKRPKAGAAIMAVAEKDALLSLEVCENQWCRVTAKSGLKGWAQQETLWGAKPLF